MIDLHLHTTASDGLCGPGDLVAAAAAARLRVISVADHDTTAATAEVAAACATAGLVSIPSVEITAVHASRDVHVLGYFVTPTPGLVALLDGIRRQREQRARSILTQLAALGMQVDEQALFEGAGTVRSVARPKIARALVAAGHVESVAQAFDVYLGEGCPAYVAHVGPAPTAVVEAIREAGGVASMAHPGTTRSDQTIPDMVEAGLTAIEVFHSAHDEETTRRYREIAGRLGLEMTGGSDYHGPGSRRAEFFGRTSVPREVFASFCRVAARRCDVPTAVLEAGASG